MKSLAELQALRDKVKSNMGIRADDSGNTRVVVGMATCGIAAGARPVLAAFTDEVARRGVSNVTIAQTGCIGICQYEPVVEVFEPGREKVTYVKMTPEKAARVAENMLDEDKFYRPVPFPTASADNDKYSPSTYWRGPVWMDQAMFAVGKGIGE